MKLVFGVLDVAYGQPAGRKKAAAISKTTGDVAEILEDKYHVFEHFWQARDDKIVGAMSDDIRDFLEDRLSGARANAVNFTAAESAIGTMFQEFINTKTMDSLGYPGIPTQAAQKGVNHRLKHPYAKDNPARPSFKDTGLYMQSFRAKVEE